MRADIKKLQEVLTKKGKTLAVAESLTGGAFSASLTAFSGASTYFLGGVVAYADGLKMGVLGVPALELEQKGAVSETVCQAMLEGVFRFSSGDYGLALTGIAGPDGGSPEKPVGTVWCAVGMRGKAPWVELWQIPGDRESVIRGTVERGIKMLLAYLERS